MASFTLSTLDRGAPSVYIRYALTFACDATQSTAAVGRLQRATKRLISEIPMLAGVVITTDHANPTVAVTLQQVDSFQATIVQLQNNHQNYASFRRQGIAPRYISSLNSTPLTNDLIGDTNSCCVIQANLINGGLVLVIYLHHAVADVRGVATIIRLMSEGLPAREMSEESLDLEAVAVSQARARLSSGFGAPAFLASARDVEQRQQLSRQEDGAESDGNTPSTGSGSSGPSVSLNRAAVFHLKLDIINQIAGMINTRRSLRDPTTTDNITPREVLIAILWRAYVHARWPKQDGMRTSISFPIDLRRHLVPPLEPHWMGNAEATVIANEDTLLLDAYYELSFIERTATIIHNSANSAASDLLTRSRIEMINAGTSPGDLPDAQLVVHDWAFLPTMLDQEIDLGLGLGTPDAVRRVGRTFGMNEFVLLPQDHQAQVWDVQVELRRD